MRLSMMLLELVVTADATLAGTHELTAEGLTHMRDQLGRAHAMASAFEALAITGFYEAHAATTIPEEPTPMAAHTVPPTAPAGNVIPFPADRHPFHGFR